MNPHAQIQSKQSKNKISPEISHSKIAFSNYHHGGSQQQGRQGSNKANFRIKQLPQDYHNDNHNMENEAREHLNLAQYNFNRMAVIDEEGIDGGVAQGNA